MTNRRHHKRRRTERKRRMCASKVRYSTRMQALNAGVRTGMDWYRCPYCKGFHLTSRSGMRASEGGNR